jgi:hypothetical protein
MVLVLDQILVLVLVVNMEGTNVNTIFVMERIQMIRWCVIHVEFVKTQILVFVTLHTLEMIVKFQFVMD